MVYVYAVLKQYTVMHSSNKNEDLAKMMIMLTSDFCSIPLRL